MMTKKRSGMPANLKILMVLPVIAILLLAFSSCNEKSKPKTAEGEELVSPPPPPSPVTDGERKVKAGEPVPADAPPPPPPPPYSVENGDTTWVAVDEMPVFPGGETGLLQYISKNTTYPAKAKENGTQGRVVVQFTVEADCSISRVKVIKGVDPDIDTEAVRVVKSLPAFEKPGKIDGRSVAVNYMVPITFALE